MSNFLKSIKILDNIKKKNDSFLRSIFLLIILVSFIGSISIEAKAQDTSKTKNILYKDNDYTPLQKLTGDTLKKFPVNEYKEAKPGGIPESYTKEQDSAYFRALRLRVTSSTRFHQDMKLASLGITQVSQTQDQWESVRRNMQVPDNYYLPSPQEIASYQYGIRQSLSVPHMNTMPVGGLSLSFGQIASLLGLVEDVSPTITYSLESYSEVEIVVYSMQAIVIATIYKGSQPAGNYSYTWNGRDDKGMELSPGDYVGEVRVGKYKYIRKRILKTR